ncbi:MAG TPA: hypothetical protein DCS13_03720 [Candidatus Margulisbacteria bacterium]|nr:MAG: hypothetical protein A2X43_03810 [Candidatus Margulisbacteria bacterium GWD2_39_127]OGI02461.1 MAG: hypothetical protein A2X42_07235 [Candidatus Margulisbacteria bacterium GWF2_38_17]OGI10954.1 MAG: hypothetical protein A2X41_01760 [Candidatus Margulisbacteria bacterium GWE2_39_32]HAR62551.1 hypothetical protein [Candidatus Margulisiibacteriota bacterium]
MFTGILFLVLIALLAILMSFDFQIKVKTKILLLNIILTCLALNLILMNVLFDNPLFEKIFVIIVMVSFFIYYRTRLTFCNNCGHPINNINIGFKTKYCPKCGNKLDK